MNGASYGREGILHVFVGGTIAVAVAVAVVGTFLKKYGVSVIARLVPLGLSLSEASSIWCVFVPPLCFDSDYFQRAARAPPICTFLISLIWVRSVGPSVARWGGGGVTGLIIHYPRWAGALCGAVLDEPLTIYEFCCIEIVKHGLKKISSIIKECFKC